MMEETGGFGIQKDWFVEKVAPSTYNESVDSLVFDIKEQIGIFNSTEIIQRIEDVWNIVIEQTKGINWGQEVDTTNKQNPNSLVRQLFRILEGEQLYGGTVEKLTDLRLKEDPSPLEFYDPGFVPESFKNAPNDVFDMKNN
jgi:hypothetical protein